MARKLTNFLTIEFFIQFTYFLLTMNQPFLRVRYIQLPIPLDENFHIPRGLKKSLRKNPFEIKYNTAFKEVIMGCADSKETWIDQVIVDSYTELFRLGYAHSVECWDQNGLQGGLYGVQYGAAFFGESMFSRKTDASKIALVALVTKLRNDGVKLLDTQWMTSHLAQFGGKEIPRKKYLKLLAAAISPPIIENYKN